jgi:hypothetical protein
VKVVLSVSWQCQVAVAGGNRDLGVPKGQESLAQGLPWGLVVSRGSPAGAFGTTSRRRPDSTLIKLSGNFTLHCSSQEWVPEAGNTHPNHGI